MIKAPLRSYTSENEQRRLTVVSRFVSNAGVLSDDTIAFLARNENHDRIPELLATAALLGSDQIVAIKAIMQPVSLTMAIPSELAAREENFFKAEYGIQADFSGLVIPVPPVGRKALFLGMHEKVSQAPEFLFQSDKTVYGGKVWKYTNTSLDEAVPTHKLTGTFGVWVAD